MACIRGVAACAWAVSIAIASDTTRCMRPRRLFLGRQRTLGSRACASFGDPAPSPPYHGRASPPCWRPSLLLPLLPWGGAAAGGAPCAGPPSGRAPHFVHFIDLVPCRHLWTSRDYTTFTGWGHAVLACGLGSFPVPFP